MGSTGPQFGELTGDEAVALLERHHVGRLGFTFHDRVDIEPIGYVFAEGCIYGRTSPGTKLTTVQHHPWVAFQVDEIVSWSDWKSVVARGTLYVLDPARGDREAYDRALAVIRSTDPEALTEGDAAPHRTHLFRVFVDEITGRMARPGA
ncbi:MAG: pyridoxamine 5'-phosphate oxidase family protein [bacterium]